MPKRVSVPDLVNKLKRQWGSDPYKDKLKSVALADGEPLRGLKDSILEFKFPVTVLCGTNGTGKTTFLQLAILGFHSKQKPLTLSYSAKEYYDFNYFFGRSGPKENPKAGICIKWQYEDTSLSITKGSDRWMRYFKNKNGSRKQKSRRPYRGTEYIGLSRITPSFEKKGYTKEFKDILKHSKSGSNIPCADGLREYLKEIMDDSKYKSFNSIDGNVSAFNYRLNYYDPYSSFNAGAGEESLTYILYTLLTAPEYSIIAIEEIESSLHPTIFENLIRVILNIANKRFLQILITTHSPDFLRNCPKETLVLAERAGDEVIFTHQPNVETAIHSIGGKNQPALLIICEDEVAGKFIELSMTAKQRDIVKVFAFGSKDELFKKAKIIAQTHKKPILIVFDGDAEKREQEVNEANNEANKAKPNSVYSISAIKLPGSGSPEKFIAKKISAIKTQIMEAYNLDKVAWKKVHDSVESLNDEHDIFYKLKENLSVNDKKAVRDTICRLIYKANKSEFKGIGEKIIEILNPQSTTP